MNLVKLIRNFFVFGLLTAFVLCSINAFRDLLNMRIGTSVRFEERDEIILPSWTLCPHQTKETKAMFNSSNVQDLTRLLQSIPVNFTVHSHTTKSVNMTDENALKAKFNVTMEETWNVHCTVNILATGCDTCLTFNAPTKTVQAFTMELDIQEFSGITAMILQLHDRDASLALNWKHDWNQLTYIVFKPGST